ncbi:MAG: glyoxalase [Bacteroidota bacterium]
MNIIELELLSDNLAATEVFYRRVFGLEPYFKESNALMCFKIGGTELIFKKSENLKPVYHFAIDVPNNHFDEAHAYFSSKTDLIKIDDTTDIVDFVNWNAKSFYFYDNNGNIAEIITRYPKKSYDNEAFSSKSYISVSEIGLVNANVPALAEKLITEEGLQVFARQPQRDDFTALGNDEGLLLVCKSGRNWYPTAIPALHFPVRMVYMDNGNLGHIIV